MNEGLNPERFGPASVSICNRSAPCCGAGLVASLSSCWFGKSLPAVWKRTVRKKRQTWCKFPGTPVRAVFIRRLRVQEDAGSLEDRKTISQVSWQVISCIMRCLRLFPSCCRSRCDLAGLGSVLDGGHVASVMVTMGARTANNDFG